ncbi:hypothetical protein CPC08DRAFT_21572 [Agrocybe pediades]|nr:hypothetical protein CPC08DRAFT_21572 [Agrocybe pediades]
MKMSTAFAYKIKDARLAKCYNTITCIMPSNLMIRLLLLFSCLSIMSLATAQSVSTCVSQCLSQANANSGCSSTDTACICSDDNLEAANNCVLANCPQEENQALAFGDSLCPDSGSTDTSSGSGVSGNSGSNAGAGAQGQAKPAHNPNAPLLSGVRADTSVNPYGMLAIGTITVFTSLFFNM